MNICGFKLGFYRTLVFTVSIIASVSALKSVAHAGLPRAALMGGQPIFQPNSANILGNRAGGTTFNPMALPGVVWDTDDWNVFLNPAAIHNDRSRVVVSGSRSSLVHGGGFIPYENFVFGLYANRRADFNIGQPGATFLPFRSQGAGSADFAPRYPLEFFLGIDYGIKWGLKLAWASRSEQVKRGASGSGEFDVNAHYWRIDSGIEFFGLELYGGTTLSARYNDTSSAAVSQELSQANVGASFLWNESIKGYFAFNEQSEDIHAFSKGLLTAHAKMRAWGGGVSKEWQPLYGLRFIHNLGVWHAQISEGLSDPLYPLAKSVMPYDGWSQWVVPVDVVAEYDLSTCVSLRAGVSYDVFNRRFSQSDPHNGALDETISYSAAPRARVGATFSYDNLVSEVSLGMGANNKAINSRGYEPDQAAFGFARQLYLAGAVEYSF